MAGRFYPRRVERFQFLISHSLHSKESVSPIYDDDELLGLHVTRCSLPMSETLKLYEVTKRIYAADAP